MKKWLRRLVKAVAALLLVLLVGLPIAGYWRSRRAWPQIDGRVAVRGLAAPVEVIRDRLGIPHLYARQESDLFFAQGYAHAQDRLWQMHFNRMIADGTFAALFGRRGLQPDRFTRTLGLRRAAERAWLTLDPESRRFFAAYSAGVNAFLAGHRDRLPIEFSLLRIDPAPWSPVDSLCAIKLMSLNLGENMEREILRARFLSRLGKDGPRAAQRLIPPYPADGPVIVRSTAPPPAGFGLAAPADADARFRARILALWAAENDPARGSNAWVIAGSRTRSGRPLLANDTHMGLPLPSIWYENGLHGGRFNVVGFSIPGIPAVVIGHNGRIAWGVTNLFTDTQDLFVETLDDARNPARYRFRGEWRDLELVKEKIEVKGEKPETLVVRLTGHGPLINGAFAEELTGQPPMALAWTALDGAGVAQALFRLDLAGDWQRFREALRLWDAPSLGFVYADVSGNIGFQAAGRHPIRAAGDDGTVPVSGGDGKSEWQGYIPFEELPQSFNPAAGMIVSANNKVAADDYPYVLTRDWADPSRARRILALLAAQPMLSREDMKRIQADTYCLEAEALRPYLLGLKPRNDVERRALAEVERWDLRYEPDRVGASVYHAWQWLLLQDMVGDELGEKLMHDFRHLPFQQRFITQDLLAWGANPWFDDRRTPRVETRRELLQGSLSRAVAWLVEHYGNDVERWTWGRLHPALFGHLPLGQAGVKPLDWIFNPKPVPAAGGPFTVNAATPSSSKPFIVLAGSSQRFIADLADLEQSMAVNSTGQSGHLFHAHRDDQIGLWHKVGYHRVLFDRKSLEAASEGVLTLTPHAAPRAPR